MENLDRILNALEGSTKVTTQVIASQADICQKYDAFKIELGQKMEALEEEMGTMNAHLDNLVREAQVTNQLLQADSDNRKAEAERRAVSDEAERQWRREIERRQLDLRDKEVTQEMELHKDTRSMIKTAAKEAWSVSKQPLAWLLVAIAGFLIWKHFQTPVNFTPPSFPVDEADEPAGE